MNLVHRVYNYLGIAIGSSEPSLAIRRPDIEGSVAIIDRFLKLAELGSTGGSVA